MNLPEWTAEVTAEYAAAGFKVSTLCGFPLVLIPETHEERVRLLKFRPTRSVEVHIYAEGMVVMPFGSRELVRKAGGE